MTKPLVVITGKNGQVGWELMQLAETINGEFDLLFTGRDELDLGDPGSFPAFFKKHSPDYFVNCAAYTAVDKAETERELAYTINATSVGIIAEQCRLYNCKLITISTDYVFDGKGTAPYQPDQKTDPVNYYGITKLDGENVAIGEYPETIVIRTSWVYSRHGNNFLKTMLRLMKERDELKVVNDQVGCPTYAADLAEAIFTILSDLRKGDLHSGIYHYNNTGIISWFDFAVAIRDEAGLSCNILPIPTSEYPTPAKRPAYSVMDTEKITRDFPVVLKDWRVSLRVAVGGILH